MEVTRPLLGLALLLVLSACASNQQEAPELSSEEKKTEIYYSHGTQALQEGRYTEALEGLLKALAISPKDAKIHNNIGMAYFFKGRHDKAVEHLNKAIDLDPKNSDAKNNLASIRYSQGNYAEAKRLYVEIGQDLVYQHQYRVQYNLALIAIREKRINEAVGLLKQAVTERDDYCAGHYLLGEIEAQRQNYDRAYEHYRDAGNGACAKEPAPLLAQGQMLVEMGDYHRARLAYRSVRERFPKGPYSDEALKRLRDLELDEKKNESGSKSALNRAPTGDEEAVHSDSNF